MDGVTSFSDLFAEAEPQVPTLVQIGKPFRFSASQIETFKLCPRKWALQKMYGLTTPSTKALARGSQLHAWLEQYLKDGQVPTETTEPLFLDSDEGHLWQELWRRAERSLPMLPSPGVARVEDEMALWIDVGSHTVHGIGYLDFYVLDQSQYLDCLGYSPAEPTEGIPLIGDHKSSSDPDRYGKGPEDLERDPQANLYATWILLKTGASHVDLFWNYIATRGTIRCRPVRVRWPREQVEAQLERYVIPYLTEMVEVWYARNAWEDIEPNYHACDAFGGCPFQNLCNISPFAALTKKKESTVPTLQEIMAKRAAAPVPAPKTESIVPEDAAPDEPVAEPVAEPEAVAEPEVNPAPAPKKRGRPRKDAQVAAAAAASKSILSNDVLADKALELLRQGLLEEARVVVSLIAALNQR